MVRQSMHVSAIGDGGILFWEIMSGQFWEGILSGGDFVWRGFCPGGLCPDTVDAGEG